MAYQKKYATDAERNAAKSAAGKKGAAARIAAGHNRGGRPKGSPNKNALPRVPSRTLTVRQPDYEIIVKCAFAANVPQVEFIHLWAESLKTKNAHLFSPDAKPVKV